MSIDWFRSVVRHRSRRPALAIAAAAVATTLTACASGPTDFADFASFRGWSQTPADTLSATERAALERDLAAAANRQTAAGHSADAGVAPAVALAIIRQQQTEEARELLSEADASPEPVITPACVDVPPDDPACAAAQ